MAEFVDQDLAGSRFERVSLRNSTFSQVQFNDSQMRRIHFSGIELRAAAISGARLLGIECYDTEISGEFVNVTINGVEIAPLIEAELNRRDPERVKMRPPDPAGYREALDIVERRWDQTIERARALPPEALHERVNGEWSFIQTLRHLNFASAAWVGRMILGNPSPWHPLDLPWEEAPGWDGIPWDKEARPDLDTVLAVRRERHDMVRGVFDSLTDEQLASTVSCSEPGWPNYEDVPFKECVLVVLNEEWEHRNFAERDLAALEA
ncbi:MAG TPA: DinB family protein [Ilumatobacteraceae bacterium]|nr:DinB family protein [Ilumatobacteraceae bacterium]